jgi:hypothetical protein
MSISHSSKHSVGSASQARLETLQRKPVRISITISHALHQSLMECSDNQGRSLSNLAAYLLETANQGLQSAAEPKEYRYR